MSRLDPADAEQLAVAAALLVVLTQTPPAAPEEAPPEAGPLFWKAVNAAAAGRYAEAIDQIAKAKAAHEKRAKALAGRGLNPLSDPLEQIFPRCCDDLKAYWELRKALYEHPGIGAMVKKDGVNKALDALARAQADAQKRIDAAMAQVTAMKTANEKLATAEKDLTKALTAEKTAAAKLDKELKAEKEAVVKLDKELKAAKEQVTDLTTKVAAAEEARKKSEAVLAGLAKELQAGKFLPEKYDDAAVLSATREVVIRASGPTVGALIPAGMAAVGGTGLTAGQLLELSQRVIKAESATRTATDKLATETKRLQGLLDTETKKLKDQLATDTKKLQDQLASEAKKYQDQLAAEAKKLKGDHAAEVKKLTDAHAVEMKKLDDARAAEVKKATDLHAAEVKKLNDKYATDTKKMADAHAAELKKLTGAPAEVADKLKTEHAAELKKLTDKYAAEVKNLTDDRAAAVRKLEEDHTRQVAALKAAVAQERARAEALAKQLAAGPGSPTTRQPAVTERKDSLEAARALDAGVKAYRAGRYFDAEAALVRAAAADPDNPLTWYFLGAARWQLGNTVQARADFEQGGERERNRRVSSRAIEEALAPIQGRPRDALAAIRP
jgi:chromosome segregation ATPase